MYSIQTAVSDGTMVSLPISIKYDSRENIHVYFDGVEDGRQWAWVGSTDKALSFSPAVANGVVVRVQRITPLETVPNIYGAAEGAVGYAEFDADTIDQNFNQTLKVAQEATDRTDEAQAASEAAVLAAEAAEVAAAAAEVAAANAELAAEDAETLANQALDTAGDAVTTANAAGVAAGNAVTVASGANSTANAAANTAGNAAIGKRVDAAYDTHTGVVAE